MSRAITNTDSGVEAFLEEAAEVSGLDPNFDSIVHDSSIGSNIPAATRKTEYTMGDNVDFIHNPYAFQELDENEKTLASIHEILEEKQFNGFLGDTLYDTHDVSGKFRKFLNYAQTEFPNSIREGMTEAIAETLMPDGKRHGSRFYPRETDIFRSMLEGLDFDLEEELLEEETGFREYSPDYLIPGSRPGGNLYIYARASAATANNLPVDPGTGETYEYQSLADEIGEFYDEISDKFYHESYADDYVEGLDGFIGTQRPDTEMKYSDPAGNNFSKAGV
ncbi:MAG: hypothetical protein ABEJ72_04275 [Candidatus Aenigmatarchaeota archaeon]